MAADFLCMQRNADKKGIPFTWLPKLSKTLFEAKQDVSPDSLEDTHAQLSSSVQTMFFKIDKKIYETIQNSSILKKSLNI